jgi:hypothetical protein
VADPTVSGPDFVRGMILLALNLLFYANLSMMLGALLRSRGPYLGIALGVILGGTLVPVAAFLVIAIRQARHAEL